MAAAVWGLQERENSLENGPISWSKNQPLNDEVPLSCLQ